MIPLAIQMRTVQINGINMDFTIQMILHAIQANAIEALLRATKIKTLQQQLLLGHLSQGAV